MRIPSVPTILAAIACVSGSVAISHASQTIASPAIFGATTQRLAQCTIGNTSTKTIDVTVAIVDEAGNVLPAASTCNEPLLGNFSCSVFANAIPSGSAVACTATAAGSVSKLRGTLSIIDGNDLSLRSAELE